MTSGRQDQAERQARSNFRKRRPGPLSAHPLFAPLLGLWGALLGGLVLLVLPPVMIAGATRGSVMAAWGVPVQLFLASGASLMLGGALFMIAAAVSRRSRERAQAPSVAEAVYRRMRTIDPARDLGSKSLDDPLVAMPFARRAEHDASVDEPQLEPAPEPAPEPAAEPAMDHSATALAAPRALDLSEFAMLPGRNAVWVEDVQEPAPQSAPQFAPQSVAPPEPAAEPIGYTPANKPRSRAPSVAPKPGTAALTRLRAVPPSELSLAQMVERFAGALHEHRVSPAATVLTGADLAAREAALAEALKSLAALSGGQDMANTGATANDPLHAALERLQNKRGAA